MLRCGEFEYVNKDWVTTTWVVMKNKVAPGVEPAQRFDKGSKHIPLDHELNKKVDLFMRVNDGASYRQPVGHRDDLWFKRRQVTEGPVCNCRGGS